MVEASALPMWQMSAGVGDVVKHALLASVLFGNPRSDESNLQSWDDETEIDHDYTFDAGASSALQAQDGFKYDGIQWSACGGCCDDKYCHERDCFDDGEKAITYRQSLPVSMAAWATKAPMTAGRCCWRAGLA